MKMVIKFYAMKQVKTVLLVAISFILILLLALHLIWYFGKSQKLNIYILDKTVTKADRIEHKSVVWLLNQLRFVGPDGKPYNHLKDYWGFYPIDTKQGLFDIKSIRLNEIDAYAAVYDAVYYVDCYGVYSYEWFKKSPKTVKSSKVYGGMNQNDYLFIKRMISLGKLVIGEYNMFSSPTNALIRIKTEDIFNVEWTGWTGKYISKLDVVKDGNSKWIANLYEKQHQKPWPTGCDGIILISNEGLVEVLCVGEDLNSDLVKLIPSSEMKTWETQVSDVNFYGWFDIISSRPGSKVLANFKLDVSDTGAEKLKTLGLTSQFPAVVKASEKSFTYYFAGDFAENQVSMFTSKLKGGAILNSLLNMGSSDRDFFNKFYSPMLEHIFSTYYEKSNPLEIQMN
jgi:hypothetical protein